LPRIGGSPVEEWRWVESSVVPQFFPQAETIFTVANGYFGMRGTFEEGGSISPPPLRPARLADVFRRRDRSDPDWRAVLDDELARWKARSYAELRAALSEQVSYERDGPGGPYQIEVALLENRADYVHVLVSVCAPGSHRFGIVCHPLSESFVRYPDGRVE
jgi:hypothetical protein